MPQPHPLGEFIAMADKACKEEKPLGEGADDSFSSRTYYHPATLLLALQYGVSMADPWEERQKLPEGYETVMNWIIYNIQKKFGCGVVRSSPDQAVRLLRRLASDAPAFQSWSGRMNIDAVMDNALCFLRDEAVRHKLEKREFLRECKRQKKSL